MSPPKDKPPPFTSVPGAKADRATAKSAAAEPIVATSQGPSLPVDVERNASVSDQVRHESMLVDNSSARR